MLPEKTSECVLGVVVTEESLPAPSPPPSPTTIASYNDHKISPKNPAQIIFASSSSLDADPVTTKSGAREFEPNYRPESQSNPKSSHDGIYWRSPVTMVACFVLGILTAVGHHLYYNSLDGDIVGDVDDQQRKLRYGTTFAFITQTSLVGSVGLAYTQWLWKTLRKTEISVSGLDAAFSADTQLVSFLNLEMLWKIKLGSFLALVVWCLPLPSLITPATIFVIPSTHSTFPMAPVPCLQISTNDSLQFDQFSYSVPILPNTTCGVSGTSLLFIGPRTILSRLSTATATAGQILPITPLFANSSYTLQFYGPAVKCEEANSTVAAIIDRLLEVEMSILDGNFTQVDNAYFGFVPNDLIINGGTADVDLVESVSSIRMQRPENASNQYWATFIRPVITDNGTNVNETHHTVCRLFNASYDVDFQFDSGNQFISTNELQILNEIKYPNDNAQTVSNLAGHSYSAFMWVLTDQLIGSMGFWVDNSTNQKYSEISTPIEHNSLLGSLDLDTFFTYNNNLCLQNSSTAVKKNSNDQRQQDINLAHNGTLPALIEELSFNMTMSLMSSNLLSPSINTTVRRTIQVNLYSYNSKNLLLAYGLSILFTLIANILGTLAYIYNDASHDKGFSAILGATREPDLANLFCNRSHGVQPVPRWTRKSRLRFRNMDEGGWSFRRMEGGEMIVTVREGPGRRTRWGSVATIGDRIRKRDKMRKGSTRTV